MANGLIKGVSSTMDTVRETKTLQGSPINRFLSYFLFLPLSSSVREV